MLGQLHDSDMFCLQGQDTTHSIYCLPAGGAGGAGARGWPVAACWGPLLRVLASSPASEPSQVCAMLATTPSMCQANIVPYCPASVRLARHGFAICISAFDVS